MSRILFVFLLGLTCTAQQQWQKDVFDNYENYRETSLEHRRIKHDDLQPLLKSYGQQEGFELRKLGSSIQGRVIQMLSVGEGETDVLLWSQMHGNEPTATMAIFDVLSYLDQNRSVLKGLKVHFIPMLNPDGAEVFGRRNAIGIDLNRDALRLQSPESRILKRVRDSLEADYGFNLHDQSRYYNVPSTAKPATLSFLAPAFNHEKDVDANRADAMKLIAYINEAANQVIPDQTGRYSDEFEPRAFGDNMQKWGTRTVLIESGGYQDDREKQFIRKLNYLCILSALHGISNQAFREIPVSKYDEIPRNDRKLFDLKIEKLSFDYLGQEFLVDLGINHLEVENANHSEFYLAGRIIDLGDLSTHFGYESISAEGLEFKTGETYPKILSDFEEFKTLDHIALLKQGYTTVSIMDLPKEIRFTDYPINLVDVKKIRIKKNNSMPAPPLALNRNPSFVLLDQNKVVYAVVNGFVYKVNEDSNGIKNGLVE